MSKAIIWIVVILVVLGGGYWWWSSQTPAEGTPAEENTDHPIVPATTTSQSTGTSSETAPMTATVTYDGHSFSPSNVTIAEGGTVTFTTTGGQMWVASNQHPTHTGYDGTSRSQHCAAGYTGAKPFDECAASTSSYSFTFTKAGSWPYHNHLSPDVQGLVTVVAAQ